MTPSAGPTVPDAPTSLVGAPGNHAVALSWNAPAANGGSAITGYVVTPYIGGVAQAALLTGSSSPSFTAGNLTNGTAYTFAVAAINGIGTGANSAQSAAVTPGLGYGEVVFADGFEAGNLSNWNGTRGRQRDGRRARGRGARRQLRVAHDERLGPVPGRREGARRRR